MPSVILSPPAGWNGRSSGCVCPWNWAAAVCRRVTTTSGQPRRVQWGIVGSAQGQLAMWEINALDGRVVMGDARAVSWVEAGSAAKVVGNSMKNQARR